MSFEVVRLRPGEFPSLMDGTAAAAIPVTLFLFLSRVRAAGLPGEPWPRCKIGFGARNWLLNWLCRTSHL